MVKSLGNRETTSIFSPCLAHPIRLFTNCAEKKLLWGEGERTAAEGGVSQSSPTPPLLGT